MEKTSFQADRCLLQSRRKRSFSLPRFGRSSAGEQPNSLTRSVEEGAKTAEDAVRAQKAAAWQWYTRGVGEAVLPTKRPSFATPSKSECAIDKSGMTGGQHTVQKKHDGAPLAAASPRILSRFKAEASSSAGPISGNVAQPSLSAATPSTPLYDEFELSGLRTQMADFVERLQQEQPKREVQLPAVDVAEGTKSFKSPDPVATPAASTDHLLTRKGPPAAAAEAGGRSAAANLADYQLTKPISSCIPVNSAIPLPARRPFSGLHRLFRKVVFGSILKSSKTSPITCNPPTADATYYPEVLACEEEGTQYHHHHYIHHHHHHYHYGQIPEERDAILRSRRRHSESSGIRPHDIPSILEEGSDEEEEVERSPIDAFLARRRRRHSDSFSRYQTSKEADFDGKMGVKVEDEKAAPPPRRYNSERFSPNKIRSKEKQDLQAEPAALGGRDDSQVQRLLNINSRRYSADHQNSRPGASALAGLEKKLSEGGGKVGGGTYKLGGGEEGTMPVLAHVLRRRRHSEGFLRQPEEAARYEMEKSTPSPAGRPYCHSSSARYLEVVLERRMGSSAMANGASSAC